MPSTATTNVTISTILDLIGPTSSSIGNDDGQPAFDSVLNSSPPRASSCPPTDSSRPRDDDRHTATDNRRNDPLPTESASGSGADDISSDRSLSKHADKASQADVIATRDNQNDSEHPEDKSEDVQQLIAQSLAAIPAATPLTPPPAAAPGTAETSTPTDEVPAAQAKSKAGQAVNRSAPKAASQSQADDSKTISPVTEITATTTEDQASQPKSPTSAEAKQSVTDETAKSADDSQLATPDKVEATDNSESAVEVTFESTLGDDKSSQSSHQESSPDKQSQPEILDPQSAASPTSEATTSANPTASPIVAPVVTSPSDGDQTTPTKPADSNPANAVGASGPRSRLPAQALVPANAANNRRPAIEVDSARLLTRVVRAFSAAQERDGEVHLRLSPPELGSLQLDIRVDNGALTARMQTETDAARTAIIDNLPALRERLAEQGVRIERFDVDLMQRQAGGMPDQQGGRQPETAEPTPRFVQPARPLGVAAASPSVVSTVSGTASGLNVIV